MKERPKIIVPLAGADETGILQTAPQLISLKPDIVEWRADYWGGKLSDIPSVAVKLRQRLENIPLLFTLRTKAEGGQQNISSEDYLRLNEEVIAADGADMMDIEFRTDEKSVRELLSHAHGKNIKVIISSHDFEKTPPKKELILNMFTMQTSGADIVKIAVMPRNSEDVLTLLSATHHVSRVQESCPLIGISMGQLGLISRIAGGLYGSCATFASAEQATAPGQIHIESLRKAMELLYN